MGTGAGGREGSSGGGNRAGGYGGEGSGKSGYGGGNASAAARNPSMSRTPYNQRSGSNANASSLNRNHFADGNRQFSGNAANAGNKAFNGAGAGYHPSSDNYGFYHGAANRNWGGGGYGLAAGVGAMGAWGMGAGMYNSGYMGYSNPYYNQVGGYSDPSDYDYSQPIPSPSNTQAAAAPANQTGEQPASNAADSPEAQLKPAIDAFKNGDYDTALNVVNKGIKKTPSDAVMHEFKSLVQFAKGDYKHAAATIHSVLAVGPGWDWTTLSSLYSDISVYTEQFNALELYVESQPQDGAAHFLLAYHYLTCGHPDSAAGEFQQVVKLVPTDKVAVDLLKMIAPPKEGDNQPPEPDKPKPSSKPVDPATLVGTWKAARDDGSKFELALPDDSSFTWKFSQKQKTSEFSGTYSVEGNLLVLNRKDGSSLIGQVTPNSQKKFNFKMLGGPSDDPGLNFGR
jgi:tetratricopeptide (TPR) repeat protein